MNRRERRCRTQKIVNRRVRRFQKYWPSMVSGQFKKWNGLSCTCRMCECMNFEGRKWAKVKALLRNPMILDDDLEQ